jgi:hypothetical protein
MTPISPVKSMESAILLPEPVQAEAVTIAHQLGISLNDLYTDAIVTYLHKYNRQAILTQLNQVYPVQSSVLDPAVAALQYVSLPWDDW